MNKKSPWKSKTLWLNGLVLGASVCGFLTAHDVVQDYPVAIATLVVLQSVSNLALRFITGQPVK